MNISGAASPVTMPCPKYGTYSTGNIAKSVVCKTAKYSFGLFMMPSMYLARATYTVSTFAGRTRGGWSSAFGWAVHRVRSNKMFLFK